MLERIKYIVNIVIVAMLIGAVAIQRDSSLLGVNSAEFFATDGERDQAEVSPEQLLPNGTRVISSASLARDIIGYGGRTPIKLYLNGESVEKIEFEDNSETPSFFEQVVKSGLTDKMVGMSVSQLATAKFDAVSGATYSSAAVIGNVQRAAQYAANVSDAGAANPFEDISFKDIMALLVIVSGVIITLLKSRNKAIIALQMALNVAVLGFWCSSFLSLGTLTAWMSNGVNLSLSLVAYTLLLVTLVMPLLGVKGSYCHMHCPLGSAQALMGMIPIANIKIPNKLAKLLNRLRYIILMALLFMMWLGVGFEMMDYELFAAFLFESASTAILVAAAIFLLLSIVIPRPYCRFICPTGALITISQKSSPTN